MLVVSFTTSPGRIYSCRPMIHSILSQNRKPDAIFLNLPPRFDRTGQEYPPDELLPDWLIDYVAIQRCDRDWGPATKLVPTVVRLQQDNQRAVIITVDDDNRYHENAVATLANATSVDVPEVWCASGFNFNNGHPHIIWGHGECCAVAEGYAGVAYPTDVFGPDFLPYMEATLTDEDMRLQDDVMVSNYLASHDVKRRVLATEEYSRNIFWHSESSLGYGHQGDALHRLDGTWDSNFTRGLRIVAKLSTENRCYL